MGWFNKPTGAKQQTQSSWNQPASKITSNSNLSPAILQDQHENKSSMQLCTWPRWTEKTFFFTEVWRLNQNQSTKKRHQKHAKTNLLQKQPKRFGRCLLSGAAHDETGDNRKAFPSVSVFSVV